VTGLGATAGVAAGAAPERHEVSMAILTSARLWRISTLCSSSRGLKLKLWQKLFSRGGPVLMKAVFVPLRR
jgi:hypothetical protein